MKIKLLILGLGLGASILAGCNDDFSSIGTSIQPGDDTIAVYMDTFQIQATTVQLFTQGLLAPSWVNSTIRCMVTLYRIICANSIVRVIFNLRIHLMREKLIRWNSIYIIMVPIETVYG